MNNVTALPCKMRKFSSFFHFSRISTRIQIHDTDELQKYLVATWAEFQQNAVDYAVDQWRKKTGSTYPCRKWLLGTFAVTLLA